MNAAVKRWVFACVKKEERERRFSENNVQIAKFIENGVIT